MSPGSRASTISNQSGATAIKTFSEELESLKSHKALIEQRISSLPSVSILAAIESAEQLIRKYRSKSKVTRTLHVLDKKAVDDAIDKAKKGLELFMFQSDAIDAETREFFDLAVKNIDKGDHPNSKMALELIQFVLISIKDLEGLKYQIPILEKIEPLFDKDKSHVSMAEINLIEEVHNLCERARRSLAHQKKYMDSAKQLKHAADTGRVRRVKLK